MLITVIGFNSIPEVREGDDIALLIKEAAENQGISIENSDVIVVAQKIVSKSEGRLVDLNEVIPSAFAKLISANTKKDPRHVEIILRETKRIIKMWRHHLITETKHGLVCANAGVDSSNIYGKDKVALLPQDPDLSAKQIRNRIKELTGSDVAVIISDTSGRPWRRGQVNMAIGVAGMEPLKDYRGKKDSFGHILRVTNIAVADELASSAELVMNKADKAPVAVIKGYKYPEGDGSSKEIIRPSHKDLFR